MSKKKILVVDDEENIVKTMEKRLQHEGYEIIKATNGEEAVIQANAFLPDLIILDILMPGMDGTKTAAFLAENPPTARIPIIFLTVLVEKDEALLLSKPYDAAKMLAEVKKLIG